MADETVTHYAKSVWTDPTALILAAIGLLQIPEIAELLVELGMRPKLVTAFVSAAGVGARIWNAQRPVAFIAPTTIKPVEVPKLPEKKD